MKRTLGTRILSMIVVMCLMLGMIPAFVRHVEVEAEAAISGVDSLTCAGFISNSTRRNYIDTMMKYYINNNSNLQTALNNGKSVVFMFEGGSDHYDTYQYVDANGTTRLQAVCIVVQMSSGSAKIVFYSENCSSIPDDANYVTVGYESSGSTTILDGIYGFQTVNHNGNYAGFNTYCYTGWYNPYSGSTGYSGYCDGINIHTRSVSYCGGASYGWCNSAGCQVIGYGASSSNEYNEFVKTVAGVSFNAYDGTQRTYAYGSVSTYVDKGYYVVDRQLGLLSPSGVEYGSGSLASLYTKSDLASITAFSTTARANASFGYTSECDFYPAYCQFKTTQSTPINSEPCAVGNNGSETLETVSAGTTFTAIGMYQNTGDNFWYQIETDSGETGYIYSGHTTYVKQLTSDITIADYDAPNGHVAGSIFSVNGTISSEYNRLNTAAVWIHSGFGTSGTKVTGGSDSVSGNSYDLLNSDIDYATSFGDLSTGKYTYAISVDYTNYYAKAAQTLGTNTGTIYLAADYFVVISSSTSQSTCSHSYSTTVLDAATCTGAGSSIKSCSKCGLVTESVDAATGHSYGSWITTSATCTADGSRSRTCSACGNVQTEVISATGHAYDMVTHPATCTAYERYEFTCSSCGDNYSLSADQMSTTWLDAIPSGMDASLFETKTQYRYSDYETKTSYETSLTGYTQKSSTWVQSGTGTVEYVQSWPSGFSTSNSLYTKYDNISKKVTASETATTKTEITSDAASGYLWYHWCYSGSFYSVASSSGSYTTFHAFYSSADNSTNYDSSDGSYEYANSSVCSNSDWYWPVQVYTQKYTNYNKQFTYERWTDYTDWSDTAATASSTRKVETRTVYRLKEASLGDHTWSNGVCSSCGESCTHDYVDNLCTICGMVEPDLNFYLFGYINGANYACEEDYMNTGIYKFVDRKLVVTFEQDSYVAVKRGDNSVWYMTDGYPGDEATVVTMYDSTLLGDKADKMFVPKGREITFSMKLYDDGRLILGYEATPCIHPGHGVDGLCTKCGDAVAHTYVDGSCTVCGLSCAHTWVDGVCSVCQTVCVHNWKGGSCEICGLACGHIYSNGYCTVCGHVCGHDWLDGVCQECGKACEHDYSSGSCTTCGMVKPTKDYYLFGYINGANYACEEDATNIGVYKFVDGKLVVTFQSTSYVAVKTEDNSDWYMANGYPGDRVTSAVLYNTRTPGLIAEKLYVPYGVEITFTLVDNGDDTFTLSYEAAACDHTYQVTTVAATCTTNGTRAYTCTICGDSYSETINAPGHTVVTAAGKDATCTTTGLTQGQHCSACGMTLAIQTVIPAKGHSAVTDEGYDATCTETGLSDGSHCQTCGVILVVQEQIPAAGHNKVKIPAVNATCTQTGLTAGYYCSVCGETIVAQQIIPSTSHNYVSATCTAPAYCTGCGSTAGNALGHDFADGICTRCSAADPDAVAPVVQPTLTLNYPSLSFESEIVYNVYFTATDIDDVVEMGLITLASKDANATITDAVDILPNAQATGSMYMAQTGGIAAKYMGDALYFKVYAKLTDGSYVYSTVAGYNAVAYANTILKNSQSTEMKALVVAMLNYGAEAQKFFGHNSDSLMNANLTAEQQALVKAYDETMVDPVEAATSDKVGNLIINKDAFVSLKPTISFDGAFAINYYFTTTYAPDDGMMLYYWTAEDYAAADLLRPSNVTGSMAMEPTGGTNEYWGQVTGIAAKELDETIYVTAIYSADGTNYTTGVIAYHIGRYCEGIAGNDSSAMQDLAGSTAAYGYYAKEYFKSIDQ